jgi:hypothetical protein
MSTSYFYLATAEDQQMVVDWFSSLGVELGTNENEERIVHYFRTFAKKPMVADEEIDQKATPLVFIEKPRLLRGTLWTDAAVVFTPSPLRSQFPALHRISQAFAKWLRTFDLVYSQEKSGAAEWNYYLEAGIQNWDAKLYALPRAMEALRNGQYFVHRKASSGRLDTLAKLLKLREYHVESD